MGNPNPGENEKADIVPDQTEALTSGSRTPADKAIPGLNLEGGAGPAQTGYHLTIEEGEIAQMFPHQSGASQVVIMVN